MWRWCGLFPVQRVRVVSWGPTESLDQHSNQDKTGTPGLEHSGRGTDNHTPPQDTPPIFSHLSTPALPLPCCLPTNRTTNAPSVYLSISRGLLTLPALQNSKGNVEPHKGKKHLQQKLLIMLIMPKESGTVMKTTNGHNSSSLEPF